MQLTKKWLGIIFFLSSLLITYSCFAASNSLPSSKQLSADNAFKLELHFQNKNTLIAHWELAPGYMLYKKRIQIKTTSNSPTTIDRFTLIPNDTIRPAIVHGEKVYEHSANVLIPIKQRGKTLDLIIHYQGCKGETFCYPPIEKLANINLEKQTINIKPILPTTKPVSQVGKIKNLLQHRSTFITIISFFIFGLLLAFTPCVLPMLPILFSVLIDQKHHHHKHMIALTTLYILSIAITFTILGIIAGLIGNTIQALAQNIWVIGAFSLIFVSIALSLFGLYDIQLPAFIRNRFFNLSQQQKPGSYMNAIVMGCLSTIVISPCVTPPLIGALVYIGTTGNVLLGGTALFFLGLGMGMPFLLLALLGTNMLPKMGQWANTIKPIFGVIMLGMAVWLLDRILPTSWILLLSGILCILFAVVVCLFTKTKAIWKRLVQVSAMVVFVYGIMLIVGSALNKQSIFYPFNGTQKFKFSLHFKNITTEQQLQKQLEKAQENKTPVMLDFYAKWCAACQKMDRTIFSNPDIKKATKPFLLLRVDLTQNEASTWKIAKQFHIYAPPSIVFYNSAGIEVKHLQIYGYIEPIKLKKIIAEDLAPQNQ